VLGGPYVARGPEVARACIIGMFYISLLAVVLTIYLTNGVPCLGRFPINFKSELPTRAGCQQKYFYHVVLGLAYGKQHQKHTYIKIKARSF